jgi:hypothetical protein
VSVPVSIQVRFDAKVRKPLPGRQAGFLRKLRHSIGIVRKTGSLPKLRVAGVEPQASEPAQRAQLHPVARFV